MRWREGRRSENIEDMRGGGLRMSPALGGGGALFIIVIALLFGINPSEILGPETGTPTTTGTPLDPANDADAELKDFVSVVLGDTEDTWTAIFRQQGRTYTDPVLVLYSGEVSSACGLASSAVGPFYCPEDHKLYLDLDFFRELKDRFGAPGDFAEAYVIAHEVGHHVQTLLGITDRVAAARGPGSMHGASSLSVRTELQADCFAGVWANRAQSRGILEAGDIDEALGAASAVGDDKLQRQTQGRVMPDSFTHGTSAQRDRWFKRGFTGGQISNCDTFGAASL